MRVLAGMGLFVLALVAGYVAFLLVRGVYRWHKKREWDRKQRLLAVYAPAVLNGSPLMDVIVGQGKQLHEVAAILRRMIAPDIELFLPDAHRTAICEWLRTYDRQLTTTEGQDR